MTQGSNNSLHIVDNEQYSGKDTNRHDMTSLHFTSSSHAMSSEVK